MLLQNSPNLKPSQCSAEPFDIAIVVLLSVWQKTDRQTDRHTKYRNPRCACVPMVNTVKMHMQTSNIHYISTR